MKQQSLVGAMKAFLSMTLLALACTTGACAADDLAPTSSQDEAVSTDTSAVDSQAATTESFGGSCCSFGAYTCPTRQLDADFDYDPPGCGIYTKPRAASLCRARCGQACVDSGWQDSCR
jgi:hypothetical protein